MSLSLSPSRTSSCRQWQSGWLITVASLGGLIRLSIFLFFICNLVCFPATPRCVQICSGFGNLLASIMSASDLAAREHQLVVKENELFRKSLENEIKMKEKEVALTNLSLVLEQEHAKFQQVVSEREQVLAEKAEIAQVREAQLCQSRDQLAIEWENLERVRNQTAADEQQLCEMLERLEIGKRKKTLNVSGSGGAGALSGSLATGDCIRKKVTFMDSGIDLASTRIGSLDHLNHPSPVQLSSQLSEDDEQISAEFVPSPVERSSESPEVMEPRGMLPSAPVVDRAIFPARSRSSSGASLVPKKPQVKVPEYNGMTPWRLYHRKFETLAELCDWSVSEQRMYLIMSLSGQALAYFDSLSPEVQSSFKSIVQAMSHRFSLEDHQVISESRLSARKRKPEESLAALAQDIKYLVNQAYPMALEPMKEHLSVKYFVEALENQAVRREVWFRHPKTVDLAVQIAMEAEAYEVKEGNLDVRKRKVRCVNEVGSSDESESSLVARLASLESEIKGLTQSLGQQQNSGQKHSNQGSQNRKRNRNKQTEKSAGQASIASQTEVKTENSVRP